MDVRPATAPLVIAVDPDAVTRGLLALYLEAEGMRLAAAATTEELPPPGAEPRLVLVSAEVLQALAPAQVERLRRAAGNAPVHVLLEDDDAAPPASPPLPLAGSIAKPVRAEELFHALPPHDPAAPDAATPDAATPDAPGDGRSSQPPVEEELQGLQGLIHEMGMDRGLIDELTRSFVERGQLYLDGLEGALGRSDGEEVDRIAHTLKGMSGNLRFLALSDLSERVRLAAVHGDLETAAGILPGLQDHFHRLCAAIERRWPPQG